MESLTDQMALIGRSGVVRDAVACLRDEERSGALLVGVAGSGKTAVVREILRELPGRGEVIRLAPTAMLSAVPFGALGPVLTDLPVHDLDSSAAVARAFTKRLKNSPAPPLFVIDDAQDLDAGTVRMIAQAVATGAARLLAACRTGPSTPEEFLALWDDGLIAKYDLAPLTRSEVHQFCEQALRADVSPWLSELFGTVTAGLPALLMSLLRYAQKTGSIGLRRGTWILLAPPDLARVPAADLVDHRVRSLPAEEQTVAAIVSLAGPLSLGEILHFSNPKTVDALEMAGIIAVSRDQERLVRPASPMVGEIVRGRVPAGRSAGLRASLLQLPGFSDGHPEAYLNRLRWALDAGAELAPAELVYGAARANAALDAVTALRAATAAAGGDRAPEAKIQLAYAQYLLGRTEAAAGQLRSAGAVPYGRPSYLAALLTARLGNAAPETGPAGQAGPAGDDDGISPGAGGRDTAAEWSGSAAPGLAARLLLGPDDEPAGELQRRWAALANLPGVPEELGVPAAFRVAELQSVRGQVVTGLGTDRQAWPQAGPATAALPLVREDLLARHCLNLVRAGEWDELAAAVDGYAAALPFRLLYSGGLLHLVRGFSRLRQGRFPESLAELLIGVEELTVADPWRLRPLAHGLAAYAAFVVGRNDDAAANARAYRAEPLGGPAPLRLLADAYCTAADDGGAGPAARQHRLDRLADGARDRGLFGVETEIRRLAVRDGDPAAAEALALSSAAIEGPEGSLLRAFARAVADSDTTALSTLSDEALAAGYLLLALEAAQQAARCLENDPHKWKLTVVQRKVHHRMVAAGMSESINIVHGDHHADLTAREAEILRLVSQGASNVEIAAALTLSTRTVEGHLYRVFAKLGVSRRSELVDAEPDFLTPPAPGSGPGTGPPGGPA
ncbi:LuxR C-terminal-related transcriptional regulator [Arthrobacter sp. YD4]|uniref:helix-turn-helix transcriptional regulator n=1 Tax=Arthrobacter sp. YD4 TaxID=3058043 RepID=UPI0025B52823|nr:LuxR family transcriptional regulator [Arthrobacter sp. YD4]MDN3937466.1 LuxR C-terminal-related transcriptional regulator [Arthrobacter sp. YD4]